MKQNVDEGNAVRILVVDDERAIRDMLRTALSREGYDATTAADADEAFDAITAGRSDLAIVDINLPGIDGMQLCRRLVGEHNIDVILMTGDDRHHSYEEAIKSGASDFLLKPLRINEIVLRVARVLEARKVRLERDGTIDLLNRLAITDELTGLFNARHLDQQLHREVARARRYGHDLSLLVLDVDHFKRVNDTYGHQVGDGVLQTVGSAIQSSIREPDTAYRHGGEEFAVLLPETSEGDALGVAERVRQAVEAGAVGGHAPIHVTVSVGVAARTDDQDGTALLRAADMAMYVAKRNGRNRVAPTQHGNDIGADQP